MIDGMFNNYSLLFFALWLLIQTGASGNEFSFGSGKNPGWNNAAIQNARPISGHNNTKDIVLIENEYNRTLREDQSVDLYLHFNEDLNSMPFRRLQTDATRRYKINQSDYIISKDPAKFNTSAFFKTPVSTLEIAVPREKGFLGSLDDLGSFTIEFWFYPLRLTRFASIFERQGFVNGKYKGMAARFNERRIEWVFKDFFHLDNGPRKDEVILQSRTRVSLAKWQHFALSYDFKSGKLTLFVDGREDNFTYLVHQVEGTPVQAAYTPRWAKDLNVNAFICKTAIGIMDEFRISRSARTDFNLTPFFRKPGIVQTQVMDTHNYDAILKAIQWRAETEQGTIVKLYYRMANDKFKEDDATLKFIPAPAGVGRLMKETRRRYRIFTYHPPRSHERFRFIQIRADLIGTYYGKYSPVLMDMTVKYEGSSAPDTPVGIMAAAAKTAGDVRLSWKKNHHQKNLAGYKIYIGRRSKRYEKIITLKIDEIPRENTPKDRVTFIISNLEKDQLYFFAISAIDDANLYHESPQSEEIYFRVPME